MKKILLIEDDKSFRDKLDQLLSLSGYHVLSCDNGKKGIETALKESPQFIICDVHMPDIDGYGVLHILSNHPKTSGTPFIFLSGNADYVNQRKGMSLGADDYLVKPFDSNDLLNTIRLRMDKNETLKNKFHLINGDENHNNFNNNDNLDENGLISENHETQNFRRKHIIYTVGQRPSYVYFIKSGKVKEYIVNEDGKELITGIYSKGDFFGFTEILNDSNYHKNSRLMEDSSIVLIPKDDFIQKIHTNANISKDFISMLSQNITENEKLIINMAYNSLRKKVAIGIIRLVDKLKESKNGKSVITVSRDDLAHVVGSSLESTIRTLKEFKTEKLIEVGDNGTIVIIDEAKIRNLRH
jgi:CRP/FNR family cyclic AMP-dependent transcriptional regulator